MTDRAHSLTVVFDSDIREDDVQPLVDAILCLRRVISVTPNISDSSTWAAEIRADDAWRTRILEMLKEARQ